MTISGAASPRSVAPAGQIPSLDGIRAVAVGLVFLAHNNLDEAVPGGLGVTVFFVLSGYLISTLMRSEFAATGGLDYRAFYLRRLLRLMPPLVCVVALAGILTAFGVADGAFTTEGLLAILFYYGNYFVISHDFQGLPAGLGVAWSLAVEEHYYLFYPPLAVLLLRLGRVRLSVVVLGALCTLVLAWRCWLVWHGASEAHLTMATDTRVDAILIGCSMALWRNPWLDPSAVRSVKRDTWLAAGCVAVLLLTLAVRDEVFRLTLRYTLQSLAIAPLIYLAVARARDWPFRWLGARPLVYIGTISYSVYLAHHVIVLLVYKQWPQLNAVASTSIAIALTLVVAETIRRCVERPCAKLRRRLHHGRREKRDLASPSPREVSGGVS